MKKALESYDLVVAVMAVGIVVRGLCGHLKDKWTNKPVVAVDSSLSCAVPIVGGHHGANELALCLAEGLDLYPAITTATDSAGRPCLEGVAAKLGAEIVNRESSKAINLAFLRDRCPRTETERAKDCNCRRGCGGSEREGAGGGPRSQKRS